MIKYASSSFQRNLIAITVEVFIYFSLIRVCGSTVSFSNVNLSTQTLDPLTTGFMITGNAANDYLALSLSTAGDINNDGFDDIIVGATRNNTAYVIYGGQKSSMSNIDLSTQTLDPATTGFMITVNAAGGFFVQSVSTAGDINNDRYDDIIVGDNGNSTAYVIYGGPKSSMSNLNLSTQTLDPATTGFKITGNTATNWLGFQVRAAGDTNNDGFDDIFIVAAGNNAAYVIYGGLKSSMSNIDLSTQALDPATTGFVITLNTGFSISTAGDINNDGFDDIFIGATGNNTAYVIYGGLKSSMSNIDLSTQALDPATTGFMIKGNTGWSVTFGRSVSTAGDINKDGYDDIIIGHYIYNGKGAAYVIYGGQKSSMSNIDLSTQTLDPATTGFNITGNATNDMLGYSVSTAGDINKDGFDDIIIGAPHKGNDRGAAYVIYGGPKSSMSNIDLSTQTLDPATTGFMITGNADNDDFGQPVSTAGDIDHDGYSDLIFAAYKKDNYRGAAYVIYACSSCPTCPTHCSQCDSSSVCTKCKNPYLLYHSECRYPCPESTFASIKTCEDCPSHCSSCTSQEACQTCTQGYTLSNSLCVLSSSPSLKAQEKASQAISAGANGIGSVTCVGSAIFPLTATVSKIVQNTRYLNLSVTTELSEIYQTWDTDMISWQVPNVLSREDHFKTSPYVFARYEISSPFLLSFWPTLLNIGIGFTVFATCIAIKKLFEQVKYKGWASSLVRKLIAGSFNFALVQAYSCLDDIIFYLVLDIRTNPFNSFFSWASFISAIIFLALGCLLVFFNFWTVYKYQNIKKQGKTKKNMKELETFNENNQYWGLFYSDFNDDDIWSQSFFAFIIIRSSISSLVIAVLYDYPLMQAAYLVILDGAIILFLYFKEPLSRLEGKLAQYYFEIITFLVHSCTFILSLQDTFEKSSQALRDILCAGIIYLNTALVGGSLGFMFIEIFITIREETKKRKLQQRQNLPEENLETQSLTRTTNPLQKTEPDAPKRQNWVSRDQPASIENSHLLPGTNYNSNASMSGVNLETSQILESDFNADNSILWDLNPRNRINRQRNQREMRISVQQPPTLNQRQRINRSFRKNHARNTRQFENV